MKHVFASDSGVESDSFPIFAVSGVTAILGFAFGSLSMPTWHVAVESAQALAGIVSYPIDNAFYQYHLGLWSSAHQVLALLLWVGFTEYALCFALSGLVGALGFLVFSLATYAVSRNVALSIISPLLIFALYLGSDVNGATYPLHIMGNYNTMGMLGRGVSILALVLVALGRYRIGFFILGLSLSVHPSWGMWCSLVGLFALLWEKFVTAQNLRKYGPWLVAGILLSVVSFAIQQYLGRDFAPISAAEQSRYRHAMLEHWEFHRNPLPFTNSGFLVTLTSIAVAWTWLRFFSRDLSHQSRLMLRFLLVAGLMGVAGAAMTWFPQSLPTQLHLFMPGRFTNLCVVLLAPTLLGIAALHIKRVSFQLLVLAHLLYVPWNWFFIKYLSSQRFGWGLAHWKEWVALGVALIVFRVVKDKPWKVAQAERRTADVSVACFAMAAVIVVALSVSEVEPKEPPLSPTASLKPAVDSAIISARDGEGILIGTGNMEMIQLKSRRPLIINTGSLDGLTYVASSGPAVARSLEKVYGIDLFYPPEDIRRHRPGALLRETTRVLFESRSAEQWAALGEEFGATQVLVFEDWTLNLPLVKAGTKYRLYSIQ